MPVCCFLTSPQLHQPPRNKSHLYGTVHSKNIKSSNICASQYDEGESIYKYYTYRKAPDASCFDVCDAYAAYVLLTSTTKRGQVGRAGPRLPSGAGRSLRISCPRLTFLCVPRVFPLAWEGASECRVRD